MIKMIIAFVLLFAIIFAGINVFRRLTGKEKMKFLMQLYYTVGIALITAFVAILIVALF